MSGIDNVYPEPTTSDGKKIVLMNLFPGDVNVNYAGVGDNITSGVRFAGEPFQASTQLQEDVVKEWQFREWVYLAGGLTDHKGALLGDWVTFEVYAPATAGTSNPGAGAYAKQALGGGLSRFIPQANGDWDLNLTEKQNANVGFTKVVPVPSSNNTGYFDWNEDTEEVTLNADGKGGYNLFDQAIPLGQFVSKSPMLDSRRTSLIVAAVKPKKILAHWKYKLTVHNGSAKLLEFCWTLFVGRRTTTP